MPRGKPGTSRSLDDADFPHGTTTGYRLETKLKATHCEPCKAAHASAARISSPAERPTEAPAAAVPAQVIDARARFRPDVTPEPARGPGAIAADALGQLLALPPREHGYLGAWLAELPDGADVAALAELAAANQAPRLAAELADDGGAVYVWIDAEAIAADALGQVLAMLSRREPGQEVTYRAELPDGADVAALAELAAGRPELLAELDDGMALHIWPAAAAPEPERAVRVEPWRQQSTQITPEADRIRAIARFNCRNGIHDWHETPIQPIRRCIHCPATDKALWVRRQEADYPPEASFTFPEGV
jgi:hypothetical protein